MYLLILYIVESLVLLTDHILTQSIKILELTRCRLYSYEYLFLDLKLYNGESWELLIRRWAKLEKDFRMKDGRFEISKIPDIYDCIKYDLQHNQKTLQYERASELFSIAQYQSCVSPSQHLPKFCWSCLTNFTNSDY
jgi:inositol hexakisphosphate/diphosphoinositol-pentakisphosphate kinase